MILLQAAVVMFLAAVVYVVVVTAAHHLYMRVRGEHMEETRRARAAWLREQDERAS